MTRTVTATQYITPLREGGSLPAIVQADDGELYVMKFVITTIPPWPGSGEAIHKPEYWR